MLHAVRGFSQSQIGLLNAVFSLPNIVLALARRSIGRRALLMTIGAMLMPLTFLILGTTTWNLWISTALMGLSFSIVPAIIWPSTAMLVEQKRLGTAYGLINVLQNLGLACSNLAAGWLNDRALAGPRNPAGYAGMLWFFGVLSFIAFVAIALLWRRESGPRAHGLEEVRIGAGFAEESN